MCAFCFLIKTVMSDQTHRLESIKHLICAMTKCFSEHLKAAIKKTKKKAHRRQNEMHAYKQFSMTPSRCQYNIVIRCIPMCNYLQLYLFTRCTYLQGVLINKYSDMIVRVRVSDVLPSVPVSVVL